MGLTSRSTLGKIAGCWLPIFIFFSFGYEYSVVNMFVNPCEHLDGSSHFVSRMVGFGIRFQSLPETLWAECSLLV
jgi:formate/nitrite transporter FocA (FNT family)